MTLYDDLAQVAVELLTPAEAGGLGATSGAVVLVRKTVTPPANSWEDPTITRTSETLLSQVFGVSAQYVGTPADEPDNGIIVASDRMAICALPAGGYVPGDTLSIDGKPVTILRVEKIPAAGVASAVKFVVR